jgi:hypothetical protein
MLQTEHAAHMEETVVLQYFAQRACDKLHFGDARKEEKGHKQWLVQNCVKKVCEMNQKLVWKVLKELNKFRNGLNNELIKFRFS